jgi:hypothetical protein
MESDIAQRTFRYTKDQLDDVLEQTEHYVRDNPAQAIGFALLAGFILNRLPLMRIFAGLIRFVLVLLKPALLAYGLTKLYEAAQRDEL